MKSAETLFDGLVARFSADPTVEPPAVAKGGKFGDAGLKVNGKLFALVSRGNLVVKLPRKRVEELVASGAGTRFDPGHGRLMKEWLAVPPEQARRWPKLADEAREFVAGAATRKPRRR
jgi:TfoX/Sxy family transcriptional regulator of competence genes